MLTFFRILLLLCCCQLTAWSQKKRIDNDSWRTWTSLSPHYGIRDDGQYCWFQYGAPATGDTLIYSGIRNNIHYAFPRGFNANFSDKYFSCQLPGDSLVLVINDSIHYLTGVQYYQLNNHQLITQYTDSLIWQDLNNYQTKNIWKGPVQQVVFDGKQLAFTANNHLRHYTSGIDSTQLLSTNCAGGLQFSRDGNYLLYKEPVPHTTASPKLRIWHYSDYYLQKPPHMPVTQALRLATKQAFPVNTPNTQIVWWDGGRYLITQNTLNHPEYYWNKKILSTLYLVDTHSGDIKMIAANKDKLLLQPAVSPTGRFMTWYDPSTGRICCYELATRHTRALIQGIGVAQWATGDSAVFIHTNNDIWKVDPRNIAPPVNLTHGRKQHLVFRLLFPGIATAFNTKTKRNGYWKWDQGRFTPATMNDALFYFPRYPLDKYPPVKARDTSIYLVTAMQAGYSPNVSFTADFNTFTPLTAIHPEDGYNWMHVTLTKHGLLYKPADFDPQKKYPVIFHYYEESKDYLHRYLTPALSEGALNIPWYVSNGYIVFVPHIQTKKRHPGSSAAKAVIRAARYLSAFSWVDTKKIGLQGHSFGGYVTNYLVTHSTLFAAAQASAGPVDFLSGYGAVRKITGAAMQPLYEQGQNKMGTTPWDHPRLYLNNSPIIQADKIHTPLLLMHNDNDNAVPFAQSIELFTALRRLQKRVWLLQYTGEGHQLFKDEDRSDFTRRQQQFFDHYLKDQPMPDWMKDH
ncbi:alpha/beta hydrolase family protein [Chitinophaga agri]|uniref:S9 family peptidase n=1 Tax=Chitinophaga agri TaxID=2703787 RepID=A0A6B9ZFB8_9BACT|nr:prolyl oligopeptidase family serine peptidase [Chitinophaga agri]QHS61070.1 S9 family peptidase [Chitinophaga agri]